LGLLLHRHRLSTRLPCRRNGASKLGERYLAVGRGDHQRVEHRRRSRPRFQVNECGNPRRAQGTCMRPETPWGALSINAAGSNVGGYGWYRRGCVEHRVQH
jgi:hypothetical protein